MHNGLLLVDKEPACTSHDVVQSVRRALRQRKVGHCGTLDPDATGLLVITLGKATRLTRFLINAPKTYSGHIRFGISTDTYDATGEVLSERSTADLSAEAVLKLMEGMIGTSNQAAPPYSAKKIKGVKYYELARRGEEVPEALKPVTVYEFKANGDLEEDRLPFTLACSSGTYVRSIAHDLGEKLGCGAHLETLRRQKVGPFEVGQAVNLADLEPDDSSGDALGIAAWIPFDEIPLPFQDLQTDSQQERRIVHGQTILIRDTKCEEGDWIKLTNHRREMIAVGSVVETIGEGGVGVIRPRIVFR